MRPRDLSAHRPYEAGGGIEETARTLGMNPDDLVQLASNENPLGPSPAAIEAIRDHATQVHAYPKSAHADLRTALAERWELTTEQVWLSAGGDGAIDYLSRATLDPNDAVLVPDPGFAYYGMSARFHHGTVNTYSLNKSDQFAYTADRVISAYDGERLVFLTSPHNPTGAELSEAAIERIAEETSEHTLIIVDEAYAEFSHSAGVSPLIDKRDDVVVVRTFSKAYGLAGLRVGYALVPREWANVYTRVNTPFAVNELGCRAGLAALDDDHLDRTKAVVEWSRNYIMKRVSAPAFSSQGNFVLIDVSSFENTDDESPASAVTAAAKRRGVILRDCSSFGLASCVRISCGTESETRTAVNEINAILETPAE